jgi:spore germination cell wall hydrolase CwlJ-like protein
MRNAILYIFSLIVSAAVGIAAYGSYLSHDYSMSTKPEPTIEYVYIEREPEVITETVYIEVEPEPFYLNLTAEECDLLEQIAFAEAQGEGTRGMVMVMNVVLNRVEAEGYGDSVEEVIFAEGQFYTDGMTPNVSDECHEAMALVLEGADFSQGALYFNKYGYRNDKEPLFQYKNHYFSR